MMATMNKRSWKLQDFMAHNANVNCLALGHKSGRVMVTGGDDKKVNLWAIGKQSCFMSLSGHTTPIECVEFNQLEELVCAGSRAGALKVWDLEAAKLVRTLNGHKYSIKSIDFHPYGEFLASGSADSSIKMWDSRKKGALFTYNGHRSSVNSIKFSPDGQWIASGGDDSTVKIWDLRVGRVLKEFNDHINSVTCVEFHPHEFLLASGSSDRSVHFFDLENLTLVSSELDLGAVRCLCFSPDGECLFTGIKDTLKVIGWEPNRVFDSVPVVWSRVSDISTTQNQLVGASFHLTNVQVYVVDLTKVKPLGSSSGLENLPSPFTPNQSIRKSFSRAERPVSLKNRTLDVKTIEESTSGTDPEEESSADITNITDYNEIFKGRSRLSRTPPPLEPECFLEPEHDIADPAQPQILGEIRKELTTDSFEALSLDNNLNSYRCSTPSSQYSRSKSNLDQVYGNKLAKDKETSISNSIKKPIIAPKFNLQRQSSCKDVPDKTPRNDSIKHSISDANISKTSTFSKNSSRKNSFSNSKTSRNSSVPNVSKIPNSARNYERPPPIKPALITSTPVDIYVNPKICPTEEPEEDEFIPVSVDKPVGLDLDDFLPKNNQTFAFQKQLPDMSEAEVLGVLMRGHEPMMGILATRQRNLKIVFAQYRSKDLKGAMETAVAMDDLSVLVDLLGVLNAKYTLWNLDLCVIVLPKVDDLLQSKYESYITTGCNTLKLILKHFGPVIKNNIQSPCGSFGVDIPREERYRKSMKCYEITESLRSLIKKKQTLQGAVGSSFRELYTFIENTFD